MKNCLFRLSDNKCIAHTQDIFTTNQLPYNFNPNANCPRFIKFLDEVFLGDQAKIKFFQETIGYGFHKSIPEAAVFFLLGGGENGKSTLFSVIEALFGEENTSSISLKDLTQKVYLPELLSKMVNISAESPAGKLLETELIKSVLSGDPVTGKSVYEHPLRFRPYAKHFLAINSLPTFGDVSHGMFRRIYILEFPRKFGKHEREAHLDEQLKRELPGIFTWALEGYRRLMPNDFRFTEVPTMVSLKRQYMEDSDSVFAFANSCLAKSSSGDCIPFKAVFESYLSFCEEEGHRFGSKIEFRKRLESLGYRA